MSATTLKDRFDVWLFKGYHETVGPYATPAHTTAWWRVMCLTGVDYFSTLAYQPSIAFLAAGYLSPIATLVLILLTLLGALPMYSRIAHMSPHGQGSILILERLFPRWKGKAIVLCLLGFAATDFVITITLSAADATAHLIENPLVPAALDHPLALTIALLVALGAIFLRGFGEAIGLAVVLVFTYIGMNLIVIVTGIRHVLGRPEVIDHWKEALLTQHGGNPLMIVKSSTKSARCIGRSFDKAARRPASSSARIISRTEMIRSPSKNMCSVRHRPMPSAPKFLAVFASSGVSALARTFMRRTPSAQPIRVANSPESSGSSIFTEPCSTWPVEPSMVIVSPFASVTPPTDIVCAT